MDRYYVIGYPASHSISPTIHHAFAEQTGQNLECGSIEVKPGSVAQTLHQLTQQGAKGCNVKFPLKKEAFDASDTHSFRATLAQAASCLYIGQDGTILADNFDGVGIINDLTQLHRVTLQDKRILVAGAGNTTRIMLPELMAQQPAAVVLANRTLRKAEDLLTALTLSSVTTCEFEALNTAFDVIINTTSASLSGQLLPIPRQCLSNTTVCYDTEYQPGGTVFTQWAKAAGVARAIDGFGMTIAHNAALFELWRGVRPDTIPLFKALSQQFNP